MCEYAQRYKMYLPQVIIVTLYHYNKPSKNHILDLHSHVYEPPPPRIT
jgi:hypothetical protein